MEESFRKRKEHVRSAYGERAFQGQRSEKIQMCLCVTMFRSLSKRATQRECHEAKKKVDVAVKEAAKSKYVRDQMIS